MRSPSAPPSRSRWRCWPGATASSGRPVFGFASALYIIPSLALFAILGPITGFVASYPTAEIALVGYTLLILIWNTVAGLDAVPADAREAATALGYSKTAALVRVDLPLALPYIFAGLRVATATVIGLVTVTALIGLGGLGQQITYGFNIAYNTPDHRRPRPLGRPRCRRRLPPGRGRATPRPVGHAPVGRRRSG